MQVNDDRDKESKVIFYGFFMIQHKVSIYIFVLVYFLRKMESVYYLCVSDMGLFRLD